MNSSQEAKATMTDKEKVLAVQQFYAPAVLHCMKRTDSGYGLFSANADINQPPHVLGIGRSEKGAWIHAYSRIQEVSSHE